MTCQSGQDGKRLDIYDNFLYTSSMRKATLIVVLVLFIATTAVTVYFIQRSLVVSFVDNRPLVIERDGERYHILPDASLPTIPFIEDKSGTKYFLLTQEQLRLLGPKLLSGDKL